MANTSGYLFVLFTVFFTVFGQIVIKWQVSRAGSLPVELFEKLSFILQLLLNPWILSALFAAFLAALSWMAAMTKFELSHAYPFMSLSFIFVLIFSGLIFKEPVNIYKIFGLLFIIIGIMVGSKG